MLTKPLGSLNPLFQEGGPRSLQISLRLSLSRYSKLAGYLHFWGLKD